MSLPEVIDLHGQPPAAQLSSAALGWFELHRDEQPQAGGAILHEDVQGPGGRPALQR
jgi:hypothetical protein